jgi:hypothetical protein
VANANTDPTLETIMFNGSRTKAIPEIRGHPQGVQTLGDGGGIEQVQKPTALPGEGRDALPQHAASQSLAQTFGLDMRAAILTVLVDLMVFGLDTVSFEILLPVGIVVAGVLGFIIYRIQTTWYGDGKDSAFIKAMIIFLLTAIPAPLSPFVAVPGGIVGIVKAMRRK